MYSTKSREGLAVQEIQETTFSAFSYEFIDQTLSEEQSQLQIFLLQVTDN